MRHRRHSWIPPVNIQKTKHFVFYFYFFMLKAKRNPAFSVLLKMNTIHKLWSNISINQLSFSRAETTKIPFGRWFLLFVFGSWNTWHSEKEEEEEEGGGKSWLLFFLLFPSNSILWWMGTFRSLRKAYGALKDSTKVGLAKVNSEYKVHFFISLSNFHQSIFILFYIFLPINPLSQLISFLSFSLSWSCYFLCKDLDIAIVKATSHVEYPPKERHVRSEFSDFVENENYAFFLFSSWD